MVTFKHTVQGKHSHEDIEYKHLHKAGYCHGEDETHHHHYHSVN